MADEEADAEAAEEVKDEEGWVKTVQISPDLISPGPMP